MILSHKDHIANSDSDCYGVCFGSKTTDCFLHAAITPTTAVFSLAYYSQPLQSQLFTITNHGEFAMTFYELTPANLNLGVAPTLQIEAFYNGNPVDYRTAKIDPQSSLVLNITADISLINGQTSVYGHRKSEILTVVDFAS